MSAELFGVLLGTYVIVGISVLFMSAEIYDWGIAVAMGIFWPLWFLRMLWRNFWKVWKQ